jgi:hypothetical protein
MDALYELRPRGSALTPPVPPDFRQVVFRAEEVRAKPWLSFHRAVREPKTGANRPLASAAPGPLIASSTAPSASQRKSRKLLVPQSPAMNFAARINAVPQHAPANCGAA